MRQRLSQHETNELVLRLEERKYGRRLNSMQLAQKASVPLDEINRVERQLPVEDPAVASRIARALGISSDLLPKIAGLEDISTEELHGLDRCLRESPGPGPVSPECQALGLQPVYE